MKTPPKRAAVDQQGEPSPTTEDARDLLTDLAHSAHQPADTLDKAAESLPAEGKRSVITQAAQRIRRFANGVTPSPTLPLDGQSLARNYSGMIGPIKEVFHDAHTALLNTKSPLAGKAKRRKRRQFWQRRGYY